MTDDIFRPAPIQRRLAAGLIDMVVLISLTLALSLFVACLLGWEIQTFFTQKWFLTGKEWWKSKTNGVFIVIGLAVMNTLWYGVAFYRLAGQTLGKKLMHIRVIDHYGVDIGFYRALIRALSSLFSIMFFGVGFFWQLADKRGQTWHDKIAGTYVINQ